jgi:hypothetical protein
MCLIIFSVPFFDTMSSPNKLTSSAKATWWCASFKRHYSLFFLLSFPMISSKAKFRKGVGTATPCFKPRWTGHARDKYENLPYMELSTVCLYIYGRNLVHVCLKLSWYNLLFHYNTIFFGIWRVQTFWTLLLLLLLTTVELSLGGSSLYTNTKKTNKNKYT